MHETSDNARRLQRVLLNVAMVGWFVALAFWFGPHVILFHKLTGMTPLDFVPVVETNCVPAVRAVKIYQRTHRRMPASVDDLGPAFGRQQNSGPGMHIIDAVRPYTYGYMVCTTTKSVMTLLPATKVGRFMALSQTDVFPSRL